MWLAALVTYQLTPVPIIVPNAAGIIAILCILGGFARVWVRRSTLGQTARCLDERQNFAGERLSTALELAPTGPVEGWRALLMSDAARFAGKLEHPRKIFLRIDCRASAAGLCRAGAGRWIGFCAGIPQQGLRRKAAGAGPVLKDVGKRIVEITHESLEHRPPALETTRKAVENAEDLGLRLDKGVLTRNDALKDLANVADKLKQQLQDLGKQNPSIKALEHAAREPSSGETTSAANQKHKDDSCKTPGQGVPTTRPRWTN